MNFSVSSLLAGFVFGVFGFWAVREGKNSGNFQQILLGIVMIVYTYFVDNMYLEWGLGAALLYLVFQVRSV